jgi:hypothetical protein
MTTEPLHKYPRTRHVEGSRCQPGDEDLTSVPFAELAGRALVVEEKMDGANAAISFSARGELLLQSRGHYLTGGARERHFDLFKRWAHGAAPALRPALNERYVMYGEWLYAKHTIYYNRLPHYFLEFDLLDRESGEFLDTERRRELLRDLPVVAVRVLQQGPVSSLDELRALLGPSAFIAAGHLAELRAACETRGVDPERALLETDGETTMEGLYVKIEEQGVVQGRYKYIRPSFLTQVLESESHWLDRPIVPNRLQPGVDLFGGA